MKLGLTVPCSGAHSTHLGGSEVWSLWNFPLVAPGFWACPSVWSNWKRQKQSDLRLQVQRCCDGGEGHLLKILNIFWQWRGVTVWSKARVGNLWHVTTSLISHGGLKGAFMSSQGGKQGETVKVCVCVCCVCSYSVTHLYTCFTQYRMYWHTV